MRVVAAAADADGRRFSLMRAERRCATRVAMVTSRDALRLRYNAVADVDTPFVSPP